MRYQKIILGASKEHSETERFRKCRFSIDQNTTLVDFALRNSTGAERIIVALSPLDYEYFSTISYPKHIKFVEVRNQTQGALATSGLCLDEISDGLPIVISAVDGICPDLIPSFLNKMKFDESDGGAIVFESLNHNYSYVRMGSSMPIEFVEKKRVSNLASSGIYFFLTKELLVESIVWSILNQNSLDQTYYFSGAMNKLIYEDKRVSLFKVDELQYFRFSTEAQAIESKERLLQNE